MKPECAKILRAIREEDAMAVASRMQEIESFLPPEDVNARNQAALQAAQEKITELQGVRGGYLEQLKEKTPPPAATPTPPAPVANPVTPITGAPAAAVPNNAPQPQPAAPVPPPQVVPPAPTAAPTPGKPQAPAPAPGPSVPLWSNSNPGFGSMYELTQEEMIAQNRFDPRMLSTTRHSVTMTGPDTFEITERKDGTVHQRSFADALKFLRVHSLNDVSGTPFDSADVTRSMYSAGLLNNILTSGIDVNDIAPSVNAQFGDMLPGIAARARARQSELGFTPNAVFEPGYALANKIGPVSSKKLAMGVSKPGDATGVITPIGMAQSGTYLSDAAKQDVKAQKLYSVVLALQKEFLSDMAVVLDTAPDGTGSLGSAMLVGPKAVVISFDPKLKYDDALPTIFHEFGHAILYAHYSATPAETKAKITLAWLDATRSLKSDTSLYKHMIRHHGAERTKSIKTVGQFAANNPVWTRYGLGLSEYLADQTSVFFLHRKGIANSDPGIKRLITSAINALHRLYTKVAVPFALTNLFTSGLAPCRRAHQLLTRQRQRINQRLQLLV